MVEEKYFKICKNNLEIEGYVDITTIDDDEPVIEYRDPVTGSYGYYPENRFKDCSDDFYDFERIKEEILNDDSFNEKLMKEKDGEIIVLEY